MLRSFQNPKRNALLAILAFTALLILPSLATASDDESQSPISGEIELRFGEYRPGIDKEFTSNDPYTQMFGTGGSFYFELGYDYFLSRVGGSWAIGGSLGYFSESGKAIDADGTESIEDTSIGMVPMRVSFTYRMDLGQRELSIPFVPYIRAGLDYYLWWIESGAGIATYRDPTTNEIHQGRGATFGWHWSAGLQFLLDPLAPQMSRTFDATTGVNNSYIFFEYMISTVDDFGSAGSLRLGDETALFGLAFEF